jgi:hypothetical protein
MMEDWLRTVRAQCGDPEAQDAINSIEGWYHSARRLLDGVNEQLNEGRVGESRVFDTLPRIVKQAKRANYLAQLLEKIGGWLVEAHVTAAPGRISKDSLLELIRDELRPEVKS